MQSLSIIVPAYNEESRLPSTLETIAGFIRTKSLDFVEVIVVDDGSRDATARVVEEAVARDPLFRLLKNPGNRGKGYAVRNGMTHARGEWVLFTDADLSAPIEELDKLIDAVKATNADGAIGSRALNRALVGVHQSALREMSGRIFNLAMRLVTGLPYKDTQCGFKLFNAKTVRTVSSRQQIDGFGFDVELLYIAKKHGLRILEVPVRWDNVEGTKVSIWKGITAFADPIQVRRNDWRGLYR